MTAPTPDAALTEEEVAFIKGESNLGRLPGPDHGFWTTSDSLLFAAVERILAARMAALTERLAEVERLRAVVAKVEALVDTEIAERIEGNVRAAVADVRCIDCNLRYEERQEYGCHESGRAHSYDEGDIAASEQIERDTPIEYVTLPVADLRAALATAALAGTGAQDEAGEDRG